MSEKTHSGNKHRRGGTLVGGLFDFHQHALGELFKDDLLTQGVEGGAVGPIGAGGLGGPADFGGGAGEAGHEGLDPAGCFHSAHLEGHRESIPEAGEESSAEREVFLLY